MRQKLKPDYDPEEIQSELIDMVCSAYNEGSSIRAVAKEFELSPMKVRKILITADVYSTKLSEEIENLYKDGKTVSAIASLLHMTKANVNSYLPYERIIYNMEERSVEADRQARYRERKKKGLPSPVDTTPTLPKIERTRTKTMVIVIGQKLRRVLPKEIYDDTTDPLSREMTYWGVGTPSGMEWHNTEDPDKNIWCAELTKSGRGKNKKEAIALMSANSGFIVVGSMPPVPAYESFAELDQKERNGEMDWRERREAEEKNKEILDNYRKELEKTIVGSIRDGMTAFCLPEERVLDYTDTIARIELVKGRNSMPTRRLAEFIDQELDWEPGEDPVEHFNIKCNWTNRKYGNSTLYRSVSDAVCSMLEMNSEERTQWILDFTKPYRDKIQAAE